MSDSHHPTTSIIKSDCAGRTRYTRQYKQEVLAAFETSSLSAPQFAAQCGLKYPTFYNIGTDKLLFYNIGTDKLLKFFLPSEEIAIGWGRASF